MSDERRQRMADELRKSGERMVAIVDDPHLSRPEKERLLDEITGDGALTLAVMLDEITGDDI